MMTGWASRMCSKCHVFIQFRDYGASKSLQIMSSPKLLFGFIFLSAVFAVILALLPNLTSLFLTTRQLIESSFQFGTTHTDSAVSKPQEKRNLFKDKFCSKSLSFALTTHIEHSSLTAGAEASLFPVKQSQSQSYPSGLKNEALAALKTAREMSRLGKTEKAAKIYQHAVDLDPSQPDILNEYGEFLEQSKKDLVNAEHMYCRALVSNPSHSKALTNRQRTLPLVEEIDQNYFNRIDRKLELLMSVPENHPGVKRMMKESYYRHIYHTTAIEGNTFTLSQTRSLVENRLAIGGKSIVEHNEILGMDAAFTFINNSLTHRIGSISVQDVKNIHKRVLGFVDPIQAGEFRSTQVFVGDYIPPQADEVPKLMEEFTEWMNSDEALTLHPIEYAALAHYKLVYIHPFYDGNGRTSRLLMNVILMQAGYPPIIIKVEEKHLYYEYLEMANNGDIRPFIRFIARCTERSVDEYIVAGLDHKGALTAGYKIQSDDGRTIIIEHTGDKNSEQNDSNDNH